MSQWARNNPEAMEEIASLPVDEQNDALRAEEAEYDLAEEGRRTVVIDPRITAVYEVVVHAKDSMVPYELKGKRGALYGLTRNIPNPSMLFAVNLGAGISSGRWEWYTDRDDHLRPVS